MSTILLSGAIAVAAIAFLAIMSTVFVGQEVAKSNDPVEFSTNTHLEGFDITAEDQKLRDELSYRWINLSEGVSADDCKKVEGDMCLTNFHYHGCCKSKPRFVYLRTVTALNGRQYTLAPAQAFSTETCEQLPYCDLQCECTLVDNMVRGHTETEEFVWFLLPSCCKCMS
ncbi:uncharacterized protein LOC110441207 [Mizuhopecten yessoensis]|uniref:Uncharacterized protein n=1 Tax=Mizuhopecten yessoensis TaxID=6573 RepID=A0A210PJS1_MIZYE|nr:uncharacterized protein LOC110441207 [Mizuhopecten yessoensis]OWF36742.1 hypothetical protein KP79_PYT02939 [Mizuhopecten yessoensis]